MKDNNAKPQKEIAAKKPRANASTLTEVEKQERRARYQRPNFWKYEGVKDVLKEQLEKGGTAQNISKKVGITQLTFYKYKSLLSAETNRVFNIVEEDIYIKKHDHD